MQAAQQNKPSPGYSADACILFNHVIAVMNLNMKFRLKCVLKIIFNYVSMCVCVQVSGGACRNQQRLSNPLELE